MKNDAEEYLKKNGLKESELGEVGKKALHVFKQLKDLHKKNPDNSDVKAKAEQSGLNTIEILKKESKGSMVPTAKEQVQVKKSKAEKIKAETPQVIDKLQKCKTLIKEDRRRRIASGEIKAPPKTTRYTKIKNAFIRILKLMPSENKKVLEGSYKELIQTVKSVFKLHGLKQAHLVEKALKEVYELKLKKLEQAD